MTTIRPTASLRTIAAAALSLLALLVALLALANPAGALQPTGPGNGDGDNLPHNAPPSAVFTITPNPALVSTTPQLQARIIPAGGIVNTNIFGSGSLVKFNAGGSSDDHGIVSYAWDLDGNGTFETVGTGTTAKVESKRFFTTGKFLIRLRVTDASGQIDTASHFLTVHAAPRAAISANVAVPLVGQTVTYSAAASTADPAIASYAWDMDGNGTFETSTGTTPTISTSYQSAGPQKVAVQITDTLGATDSASLTEQVNQAPIAAFTDAPSPAFVGEAVHFDGSSSSDDSPIADYAWDLDGDGTFETDTHANPVATKVFTAPATINVRLRVTDSHGVTSTVTHALVIKPAPVVTNTGSNNNNGTTTTPTDTTAPKETITPRSVKVSKTGKVALKVTCSKTERSCVGRLALRAAQGSHNGSMGSKAFRLGGGQTVTLRIQLSKANRKLVKRLHTVHAKATATATDAAGNKGTSTAKVTIKR